MFQDNKLNVYLREATKEVMLKMGISKAWQQNQERMNRDLKAQRITNGNRTLKDLILELRQTMRLQKEDELSALHGKGDLIVISQLQGYCVDDATWRRMSSEEKESLYLSYVDAPFGK